MKSGYHYSLPYQWLIRFMLSYAQFSCLYPNLALFAKEKGWRCGKSFISHRRKCYTNPKTGQKLGYKYELNPKTGRKRKVRVGLNYKEYQKARSKALKKRGQGKKLTSLEQKYIADIDRLATSTRKKKQRALDAKANRNWKKEADLANQTLLKGGKLSFTNSSGRKIEASYIEDNDVGYLKIDDATKKRNLSKRIASKRDLDNYVSGLFNPKQRKVTGDGKPVIEGKVKNKRLGASSKTKSAPQSGSLRDRNIKYRPSNLKYQDLSEQNQIFYDGAKKKIEGFDDDRVLATIEAIAEVNGEDIKKRVNIATVAEAIQYETAGGVKNSTSPDGRDRINRLSRILDKNLNPEKKSRRKSKTSLPPTEVDKKIARKKKLDNASNQKAAEIVVGSMVTGSFERDTQLKVAELIDRSKKEVIDDLGTEITKAIEDVPTTIKERKKGNRTVINPEWRSLSDKIEKEVFANQEKLGAGVAKRNSSGQLKAKNSPRVEELKDRVDAEYWNLTRSNSTYLPNPQRMSELATKKSRLEEESGKARIWNRPYSKKSQGAFGYQNQTVHKRQVERAIAQGKKIPNNVISQYPDLKLKHRENKSLRDVTKQEYINQFPRTRKKIKENYGEVDIDKIGNEYVVSYSDRKKDRTTNRGQGKSLKEAAYSFAVRNKLAPDHFKEVREAVKQREKVSDRVLQDYPDAFAIEIEDRKRKKKTSTYQERSHYSKFSTSPKTHVYGIWWSNRTTATAVSAKSAVEARRLGIKKYKKGYGSIVKVARFKPSDAAKARRGDWPTTRSDGLSANKSPQKSNYRPWLFSQHFPHLAEFQGTTFTRKSKKGKPHLVRLRKARKTNKRRNLIRQSATLAGILGGTAIALSLVPKNPKKAAAIIKKAKNSTSIKQAKQVVQKAAKQQHDTLNRAKQTMTYAKTGKASSAVRRDLDDITENLKNPNYKWEF